MEILGGEIDVGREFEGPVGELRLVLLDPIEREFGASVAEAARSCHRPLYRHIPSGGFRCGQMAPDGLPMVPPPSRLDRTDRSVHTTGASGRVWLCHHHARCYSHPSRWRI